MVQIASIEIVVKWSWYMSKMTLVWYVFWSISGFALFNWLSPSLNFLLGIFILFVCLIRWWSIKSIWMVHVTLRFLRWSFIASFILSIYVSQLDTIVTIMTWQRGLVWINFLKMWSERFAIICLLHFFSLVICYLIFEFCDRTFIAWINSRRLHLSWLSWLVNNLVFSLPLIWVNSSQRDCLRVD